MNVLAVLPSLREANPGGIQVSARVAWEALQQTGHAALLEVSARERLGAVRAARSQPHHFDVVLFWHLDLLRLAPFISRRARRAVFLHGIEAWRRPDAFTRWLLRECGVLANSRYTIERARATLPVTGDMQVVHLGLGDAAAASTLPAEPPVALMISRLDTRERYKGHDEVLSAWPLVQQQLPLAQLWIVGDGDLRDDLESLTQDPSVRFFGRVTEPEKRKLIEASRCLVLPSRGEGFGLVYLEAMRSGRPCLVGVDAGVEVVNPPEAGLSADPSDKESLVSALVRLLKPGMEWDCMAEGARRRYEKQFTANHFQERLLAALEQLI